MQVLCSDLGNCNNLNKLNRYKKLYRTFLAYWAEIHKFISDCKHDLVDRAIEITACAFFASLFKYCQFNYFFSFAKSYG